MVHPCKSVGCRQGRDVEGLKVSLFKFPYDDPELMQYWIQFCNRKDWSPNYEKKCDHLCSLHFEDKFIRNGKSRRLDWRKKPVPTIHSESSKRFASCLPNMKVPRKDPFPRIFQKDELNDFRRENRIECLEDLKDRHAPPDFTLLRNAKNESVVFHKMEFDGDFPKITMAISIDKELHVKLQLNGSPVPLPEFFRKSSSCKLTCATSLTEFANYMRNLTDNENFPFLDELVERRNYDPRGRPPYSAALMRYALLIYHTSRQAYKLLLEKFPLPSMSLLDKLQQGQVDTLKAITLLKENGSISKDVRLMGDEMYLQRAAAYQAGKYVGEDQDGTLYKGVFVLMIVGLNDNLTEKCPTGSTFW